MPVRPLLLLLVLSSIVLNPGCARSVDRTLVPPAAVETLDEASPYLKAHLRDGHVYILSGWEAGPDGTIRGEGARLNAARDTVRQGALSVPADSVLLYETNVVRTSNVNSALVLMAGVTAALAGYCALNPKSCFGSCPTVYARTSEGERVLQAEGFSASIAPALEATDLDLLYDAPPAGSRFELEVTNEALETHVIRRMDLLVAARPVGGRVFPTPGGELRAVAAPRAPAGCAAAEGSCREALASFDGVERWSEADSTNLATREVVELSFAAPPAGEVGLVLTSRQTLLTTYLIYQALAYMGTDASRWLARLETGGEAAREIAAGMGRELGWIEVLVSDGAGGWIPAGEAGETGPLARETVVIPLPPDGDASRIRLRMTQGLWRLDQARLARLGAAVEPIRVRPAAVRHDGALDTTALASLRDPDRTLVTLPGDAYEVEYSLPADIERPELLLDARGYYLEWMRREWLEEEDPAMAYRLFTDPAGMLRRLAPAYKAGEAAMDSIFWGSRYARD